MAYDKERFRKMFPHLAKELESGESKVGICSMRSDINAGERAASSCFEGYAPDIIDFLRRCDTNEQAVEIIDFMERRNEISAEYAGKLRKQLKERGVRSFGSKKETDYYLKRGGYAQV